MEGKEHVQRDQQAVWAGFSHQQASSVFSAQMILIICMIMVWHVAETMRELEGVPLLPRVVELSGEASMPTTC